MVPASALKSVIGIPLLRLEGNFLKFPFATARTAIKFGFQRQRKTKNNSYIRPGWKKKGFFGTELTVAPREGVSTEVA